ncbi:MAG: tRNA (N6-isopentenyl adenosine(37)-C2)-methylthiotransferase MiaB, partial [Deltaproteobacteria bacterium]|nr:tRNA (N6-isopentenyl adenosine(37)-C2)-methylthiotransferase MiaB [Deltaproteobacteria bacterium]
MTFVEKRHPDLSGKKAVHIVTFGCQMNVFDSRRMLQILSHLDYAETENPENADMILINTCTVRDKPEKKVLSALGRFRPLK